MLRSPVIIQDIKKRRKQVILLPALCLPNTGFCTGRSKTAGANSDIQQAAKLARAMVTRYGMRGEFGIVFVKASTEKGAFSRLKKELTKRF